MLSVDDDDGNLHTPWDSYDIHDKGVPNLNLIKSLTFRSYLWLYQSHQADDPIEEGEEDHYIQWNLTEYNHDLDDHDQQNRDKEYNYDLDNCLLFVEWCAKPWSYTSWPLLYDD